MERTVISDNNDILELTLRGKQWKLGRIGFSVRIDAEDAVRRQRRIEFKEVLEALADMKDEDKSTPTLAAFDHLLRNVTVSIAECTAWMGTPSGEVHQLWKSLQAVNPEASLEQAAELYDSLRTEEYAQIQDFWARSLGTHRVLAVSEQEFDRMDRLSRMTPAQFARFEKLAREPVAEPVTE